MMDIINAKDMPSATGLPLAFYGTVIHSTSLTTLEYLENCFLIVNSSGVIQYLQPDVPEADIPHIVSENGYAPDVFPVKHLRRDQFLCPGFVDTHNHAPQWMQRGVGARSQSLLDWLEKTTFAHEARFEDPEYARATYARCVQGFLKQGITTACYYGSIHGEACKILADTCLASGQRALVGKCNMTRNAPEWYRDDNVETSLRETNELIGHIRGYASNNRDAKVTRATTPLVQPILTPRFAVSCDEELLAGLGRIARDDPDLRIQTHFNEAKDEMAFTKTLFPQFETEAELYDAYGLLTERSILAHCIYLQDSEMARLVARKCGIAHCPIANTTMQDYMIAPVQEYLRRGLKVGLGTDSGGAYSSSMLDVMRHAYVVSNARRAMTDGRDPALSLAECFFLATLGGAQVCGLDETIGNFTVGKEFDAMEIHTMELDADGSERAIGVITPVEGGDSAAVILEKFLMTGDDRNIAKVYVCGRSVKA